MFYKLKESAKPQTGIIHPERISVKTVNTTTVFFQLENSDNIDQMPLSIFSEKYTADSSATDVINSEQNLRSVLNQIIAIEEKIIELKNTVLDLEAKNATSLPFVGNDDDEDIFGL